MLIPVWAMWVVQLSESQMHPGKNTFVHAGIQERICDFIPTGSIDGGLGVQKTYEGLLKL